MMYPPSLLPEMSTTGHPLSPSSPSTIFPHPQHTPEGGGHSSPHHPSSLTPHTVSSLARGTEIHAQLKARLYASHEVYSHTRPQLRVARRRPQKDEASYTHVYIDKYFVCEVLYNHTWKYKCIAHNIAKVRSCREREERREYKPNELHQTNKHKMNRTLWVPSLENWDGGLHVHVYSSICRATLIIFVVYLSALLSGFH